MRFAISIRGGGVIIPCYCLMKLEEQLGGVTCNPIDYCAGTSTGALLTAAIAAGMPASVALKVYTDRSSEIFTPTGGRGKKVCRGIMYDPTHLHDVMVSVLGKAAA
jgi:patatin-like phospholipase/acyl hydrolase